jgi:hypothetical protein
MDKLVCMLQQGEEAVQQEDGDQRMRMAQTPRSIDRARERAGERAALKSAHPENYRNSGRARGFKKLRIRKTALSESHAIQGAWEIYLLMLVKEMGDSKVSLKCFPQEIPK